MKFSRCARRNSALKKSPSCDGLSKLSS
jgi:hypothetical protein